MTHRILANRTNIENEELVAATAVGKKLSKVGHVSDDVDNEDEDMNDDHFTKELYTETGETSRGENGCVGVVLFSS